MSTFYTKGPNATWNWTGVCEVTDNRQAYWHHFEWPKRTTNECKTTPAVLADLLARGAWILAIPDSIRLPLGA